MSTNTGNATKIQTYAEFSGRVAKNLWPALKGKMTSDRMASMSDGDIIDAIRKGFLSTTAIEFVPLNKMKDVWISDNAKELFNDNLGTVCKTEADELSQPLNDHEIIEKYGEDIIFNSVDDLEATIADLISKQPDGKSGKLLNNSYANIFYVRKNGELRCVDVGWHGDKWRVYPCSIDDNHWLTGHRVFRNCRALDT